MSSAFASISLWDYRDTGQPEEPEPSLVPPPTPAPAILQDISEQEAAARVEHALANARASWQAQLQQERTERDARLAATLEHFLRERQTYFREVEQEVVSLALAVARKLVQRELSLDPMLLQALVRIALDRLGTATPATVRVASDDLARWQKFPENHATEASWELVEDPTLQAGECHVETSLGTASLGLESQLKDIEQSFQSLLAQRPEAHAR